MSNKLESAEAVHADALLAEGAAYGQSGKFLEALACFNLVAQRLPKSTAPLINRAWVLKRLNRHEEALASYHHAIKLQPGNAEVHWNTALLLLQLGNYKEGFDEFEWRWQWDGLPSKPRDFGVPKWQPSNEPNEVVLIYGEQGFGDTLQFARWIPALAKHCKKLYFEVQPELFDLIAAQNWPCEVIKIPNRPDDITRSLAVMSIPHVCGIVDPEKFRSPPYLRSRIPSSRQNNNRFAIGIVWRGRPTHGNDSRRSLELAQLSPLFTDPEVRWVSLSAQDLSEEIQACGLSARMEVPIRPDDSFAATAEHLSRLDLVISVDTSVAHLAGAMGIPCLLLLPHQADWRWGISGETTPWYDSMKLYRCPADLAWEPVVQQVLCAVQAQLNDFRKSKQHMTDQPIKTIPYEERKNNLAFTFAPNVQLRGVVKLESPFRAWTCTLNNFTGGAFSYISPNCSLHRVSLGRYCSIGNQVEILSQHPTNGLTTSPFPYQSIFDAPFNIPPVLRYENLADTHIGHDVWIGAGVKIKSGVTIGNGAIIGAGSVVTKDVPPYAIAGGTPARLIRMRFADALIERIERVAWWRYDLLGLNLAMDNPEAALEILEAAITAGKLRPYDSPICRVWMENGQILARAESPAGNE